MSAGPEDIRLFSERTLDPAEARAYLDAPISQAERDEVLALVRWFEHRYPTPLERLSYVRRAYRRWRRALSSSPGSP